MAHIDKMSLSSSNDSLTSEMVHKVKLVASDIANSSKTDGQICEGHCDQHRLQNSGSKPCSNTGNCLPFKAAISSGNNVFLGSLLKTGSDIGGADKIDGDVDAVGRSDSDVGGVGQTVWDINGAGCSTGGDFSAGSCHCNYRAGYNEGYSKGLQNGFQAGYEEAKKDLRKSVVINNSSKNLGILAVENKADDNGSALDPSSAEEEKTGTSMQSNALGFTIEDESSTCGSNKSSECFSSLSSVSSGVHSKPQLLVLLHNQPEQGTFRKQPSSPQEQLLAEHTTEVFHHPPSSETLEARFGDNVPSAPTDCSICMTSVTEDSPYQKGQDVSRDLVGCVAMKLCGHHFHTSCLIQMASHNTSGLTCPNCQTIHGVRIGIQPLGGRMDVMKMNYALPGFLNSATYQISYSFPSGIQGAEHPSPGRPYRLVGFPRVAFIPATDEGEMVLKLLRVAFDRRLIFTIGTSATSGATDCVVWNGIHHKTETQNYSGHGYPDPKYLGNVLMELASFGVTEQL